jgi:hypothetical protein
MITDWNHRLDAMRRRNRRNYWTGMAWLVILGAMQVPIIYAAWRLFCAP